MAARRHTSVLLNEELLRRTRKSLKVSSNTEAITKALREVVTKKIEFALKSLILKGRGRFVDVYAKGRKPKTL